MRFHNFAGLILSIPCLTLAQWSEPQIRNMVTDSPWARPANVTLGARLATSSDSRVPAGAARTGDEPGGTGSVPRESEGAAPSIIVRWDSALPVYEACAAGGLERYLFSCYSKLLYLSGQSHQFTELAKSYFILTVAYFPGTVAPARVRNAPQHSAAAQSALEQMGQNLQRAIVIKRKGKSPFRPEKVVVLPAGKDFLVVAFFPRTEVIAADGGNLSFELSDGAIEIRAKFDLRKMIYKDALAL